MAKRRKPDPFDVKMASCVAESFAQSCGIPCQLGDGEGNILFRQELCQNLHKLCNEMFPNSQCNEKVQMEGARQAERFGGRYIYFCPIGMGWVSAPIMQGGKLVGSLSAGPVMMMDIEDYFASTASFQMDISPEKKEEIVAFLRQFPYRDPAQLSYLSLQLLACAVYISGNERDLLLHQNKTQQQQNIGSCVQQLKKEALPKTYPRAIETMLLQAVTQGSAEDAGRLLNQLLGHILYACGGEMAVFRVRVLELTSLLSRAAVEGGADLEQVLLMNQEFLAESERMFTADDLSLWLARVVQQYTMLVFDMADIKNKGVIFKAINYMKQHLSDKLQLSDVAEYVGFSAAYFSRLFHREMGSTFQNYLRFLRIERSKLLLLSSAYPISDIYAMVGFEDQSYFTKVFRDHTGVTPLKFRAKQGRIDETKERSR